LNSQHVDSLPAWSVVIAAAGTGSRMGTDRKKPYLLLGGRPILDRTIECFRGHEGCGEIVVVVHPDEYQAGDVPARLEAECGVTRTLPGGPVRQQSVLTGIESLAGAEQIVLIHDAVRPLVTWDVVRAVIEAAHRAGAALAMVRALETVKRVSEGGVVIGTPARDDLWFARTPQGFGRKLILEAYRRAAADGFRGTDDAQLVERLGRRPLVVEDSYENIKITTPAELAAAEAILRRRAARGDSVAR